MTKTLFIAVAASALLLTAAPEMQQGTQAPEISTQEDVPVFQSKVTLIEVPVVVRDKNGKAVGTLSQDDFQLFDRGKPQEILKFSVEKSGGGKAIASVATAEGTPEDKDKRSVAPVIAPDHFVGLLFDDIHTKFADQVAARVAAQKFVASSLKPADRVAIFTSSGRTFLDFTDDRDLLNKTLLKVAPRPIATVAEQTCPSFVTVYQANQMINLHDGGAIGAAVGDVEKCFQKELPEDTALGIALAHARSVLEEGRYETSTTVVKLEDVVRKMAEMPGQRTLILASPGFIFMQDQLRDGDPAIDLAIRSGVVINALDVKGVIPPAGFIAENGDKPGPRDALAHASDVAMSGTLDALAFGTGGRVFHENFLDLGLQELGTVPEVSYLLGFSPQNLKLDGKFHSLKVSLKNPAGMTVQARLGYYAPTHLASAEEEAKDDVTQALFSRDEMNAIPVEMNTRFFKSSESQARLSVTSHVDVRKLRFRKADGRNIDNVRVVCALFDSSGNLVQGVAKTIQMNLLDATLEGDKLSGGIPVRSDFTVAPGTYVIRVVVRDAEGEEMTAQNSAVRIP